MRILLDCRFQEGAGPNVATRYLLDCLVRLNRDHEFVILQHRGQDVPDYPGIPKLLVPTRNPILEFLWIQLRLPSLLKREGIDLCHDMKHVGPLFTSVPTVLHVHEINHLTPEGRAGFQLDLAHRIYWNRVLIWGLKRATRVFAITEQSAAVMASALGIPKEKIDVIYYGYGDVFRPIEDREAIRACLDRYGLPEHYLLCVGNVVPQENYDTALRMLAKLPREEFGDYKLAIAGDTSEAGAAFFDAIESLGLRDRVVLLGYVGHDDLAYIYNGAALLVFPPVVATFSTPPIEAMACGIPVVASALEGTVEVTGGAAVLFQDPRDDAEMLHGVVRVLRDGELRRSLRQKGLERAGAFSWEASARKALSKYLEVVKA